MPKDQNKQKIGLIKRWRNFLNSIPHLFAKLTVIFCVIFAAGCSVYSFRIMANPELQRDPSTLLGVVLAFFGGELLLLCLRNIFSGVKNKNNSEDTSQDSNDSDTFSNF